MRSRKSANSGGREARLEPFPVGDRNTWRRFVTHLHSNGNWDEKSPRAHDIQLSQLRPARPESEACTQLSRWLYDAQGRYAEAEPLYKRSLSIREKALGPEHPNVAQSLENYAALLRKTGRDAEAARMETRAKKCEPRTQSGRLSQGVYSIGCLGGS